MESQVKFCSPQNISGALEQNSVAAETTKVHGNNQIKTQNGSIQLVLRNARQYLHTCHVVEHLRPLQAG